MLLIIPCAVCMIQTEKVLSTGSLDLKPMEKCGIPASHDTFLPGLASQVTPRDDDSKVCAIMP